MGATPQEMAQIAEWDAVERLYGAYANLQNTHSLDPTYESARVNYDEAVRKFRIAAEKNRDVPSKT